jgi:hypothetical protein
MPDRRGSGAKRAKRDRTRGLSPRGASLRDMKASRMSVECPICDRTLAEDVELRDHLAGDHSARELAAFIENELEASLE